MKNETRYAHKHWTQMQALAWTGAWTQPVFEAAVKIEKISRTI